MLTRQPVQGRANDGGLRIGEMERDGIMAHGASAFLNESFMVRGDEYYMAVCNKTGGIAIYNESLNLFLSPFADGPINFNTTLDGKLNIQNVSRFGRDFSIVRVPYALKLLIQELQTMNVQMRIITEDNIDQVMNMSYSDNIGKLLKTGDYKDLPNLYNKYKNQIYQQNQQKMVRGKTSTSTTDSSIPYADGSPAYNPPYDPNDSPAYDPNASPAYNPISSEPNSSPAYNADYSPHSPDESPPRFDPHSPDEPPPVEGIKIENADVKTEFDTLPERDKIMLMKMAAEQRAKKNKVDEEKESSTTIPPVKIQTGGDQTSSNEQVISILKVEEEKQEVEPGTGTEIETSSGSSSETKSVSFDTGSTGVKQIIL
jgi:hypothetical protein